MHGVLSLGDRSGITVFGSARAPLTLCLKGEEVIILYSQYPAIPNSHKISYDHDLFISYVICVTKTSCHFYVSHGWRTSRISLNTHLPPDRNSGSGMLMWADFMT